MLLYSGEVLKDIPSLFLSGLVEYNIFVQIDHQAIPGEFLKMCFHEGGKIEGDIRIPNIMI